MRSWLKYWVSILVIFLAACGGGAAVDVAELNLDEESGLVINPDDREQAEPYIVEGTIRSMNLIPAARPEFLILAGNGRQFRIDPQPIGEITFQDGTVVSASDFQIGMSVRATVTFDPEMNGGLGGLRSEDFKILSVPGS